MSKILILTQELWPERRGGSAKVAAQQAKWLAQTKNKVKVLTMTGQQELNSNNYDIEYYPASQHQSWAHLYYSRPVIKKILRDWQPDIVIIQHPILGKAWLSLKANTPFIYMWHASTALEISYQGLDQAKHGNIIKRRLAFFIGPLFVNLIKRWEKQLLAQSQSVWTLSHYSQNLITQHFPTINKNKIQLMPYAVHPDYFKIPQSNKEMMHYLTVRRLVPRMGLEWLIKAWAEVIKIWPKAHLTIIGQGYLYNKLRTLIHSLRLNNNISLSGELSEKKLQKAYQQASCFILPTLAYEGLGLATLEAMAAGLPVIGTNIGATPTIINQIAPALLLSSPDANNLINCLQYQLNHPQLQARVHEFIKNNYQTEPLQIYQQAIEEILNN